MQDADRIKPCRPHVVSESSPSGRTVQASSAPSRPSEVGRAGECNATSGWTNFAAQSALIPADLGTGSLSRASEDFGFGVGPPVELPPGTDLGGITIVRALGAGGMGRVYEACQQSPGRPVAVKVMRDGLVSPSQMKRFEYEAQLLARLRHPHIAQIYALATARVGVVSIPYFVMELVLGARPITVYCEARGMSVRSRVAMLKKVTAAVAHGHQKGVIHRDLKPGNILVGEDGEPKVIDFGIARSTDREASTTAEQLTAPGQVVGTLHYMSPEQLAGRADDIDARSDVHALGIILHEILAGRLPYALRGHSVIDAIRIVHEEVSPVQATVAQGVQADPEVTRDDARSLGVIVARCLEKRPADRYSTAAELEAELGRWLAGEPIVARPLSAGEQLLRLARRHRAATAAIAASLATLVAAVVGISFFAVRAEREGAAARSQLYRASLLLSAAARDRGAEGEAYRLLDTARGLVSDSPAGQPLELACLAASLDDTVAVLKGHTATVRALAWAPQQQRLVSAAADGTVRVWDRDDRGKGFGDTWRPTVLATLDSELWSVGFLPDGDRVAGACADGTARVWDCATGREVVRCGPNKGIVYGMACSPDGRRLVTGGRDGAVRIWDAATGREEMALEGHTGTVYSVAYAPDGVQIASASQDATLRLWDAATGAERATLRGHGGRIFSVAFSRRGDLLATAAEDATVRVWDVSTGEQRAVLQHPVKVNAVSFAADGRVVTASNDAVLRIWDSTKGLEMSRRHGHKDGIWSVASAGSTGWIASGGVDATVRVWREDFGSNPAMACGSDVRAVAHDRTAARLAVATTSGIELWDAARAQRVASLTHDGRQVNDVRFFPDCRWLAAACDRGIVEVWPVPRLDESAGSAVVGEARRFPAHSRRVYSIDVDAAGERLATAGEDKAARIWRWGDEPSEITAFKHEKRVLCSRFSADGAVLYTACEDRVARGWEIATGRERVRFEGHREPVNWVAPSPDGTRLATASSDGTVRLWSAATGELQVILTGPSQQIWKVAFTPDKSRVVAVSADGGVYLWDAAGGEPVSVLRGHAAPVWGVSVSPEGEALVSGGDSGALRFWGIQATRVRRP